MQLQKWIEKNTEFQADGSVMVICGQRPLTPSQPSSLPSGEASSVSYRWLKTNSQWVAMSWKSLYTAGRFTRTDLSSYVMVSVRDGASPPTMTQSQSHAVLSRSDVG